MEQNFEIDLRDVFKMLLKRIWIILLCAVLVGSATLVYTLNFVAPQYQASVTMYVNNNSSKDNTYVSSNDLAVALRLVATYVNIIKSDRVLDRVIADAGLNLTTGQIRSMISAEPEGETEMFRVTVTSTDPQLSANIANTIAKLAPAEIAEIIEGSSAKIIDEARVPRYRSSPSYSMSAILGAFIGGFLAVLVLVLMHLLDMRIKNEEDLKKICDVPVLGVIPNLTNDAKTAGKKARK